MTTLCAVAARVLAVSLGMCPVIALLLLLRPALGRRYRARAFYWVWLVVALRLALPVNLPLFRAAPVQIAVPDPVLFAVSAPGETPARSEAPEPPALSGPAGAAETQMPPAALPASGEKALHLGTLAALVWLAGAAIFLVAHLAGYVLFRRRVARWSHRCTDAALNRQFGALRRELGARRVRLRVCAAVPSPLVTGLFRPVLLLPTEDYTEAEQEAILRHELVHAARGDVWYKLLLLVACAVHWFDPLVHLMARRAGRDLEIACDEAVVAGQPAAFQARYGHAVLSAAEQGLALAGPFTTHFRGGKNAMKERLAVIAGRAGRRRGVLPVCAVALAAAVAAAACSVGAASGGAGVSVSGSSGSGAVVVSESGAENGAGSGSEPVAESDPPESGGASGAASGETLPTNGDVRMVVAGEAAFFYMADDGAAPEPRGIGDVPALFDPDDEWMAIWDYAVLDLDGSGNEEAVLRVSGVAGDTGGFLVFRRRGDTVYAFRTGLRMFEDLKTDGTFTFSDAAGTRSGVASLAFTEEGLALREHLSASGKDFVMDSFVVNGKSVSEKVYDAALEEQKKKPAATWVAFNGEGGSAKK